MLSLMFFALFFISASLGGKGSARPEDELHVIRLTWEQRYNFGDQALRFPIYTDTINLGNDRRLPRRANLTLSAGSVEKMQDGNTWDFAWSDAGSHFLSHMEWEAWSDNSGCHATEQSWWYHEQYSEFTHFEDSPLSPSSGTRALAVSGTGSKFTVSSFSDSSEGRDVPGPHGFFQSNTMVITYRPEDIHRNIILEVGVFPQNLEDSERALPINIIKYRAENIGTDALTEGQLFVNPRQDGVVWTRNGSSQTETSDFPLRHRERDCRNPGGLLLYVTLTPDGAIFSAWPPGSNS